MQLNDGRIKLRWTGADQDGDRLIYGVYLSYDGGRSRVPIRTALKRTEYAWKTDLAPGADNTRIIVTATDGFHTSEAWTQPLPIPRKKPVVRIMMGNLDLKSRRNQNGTNAKSIEGNFKQESHIVRFSSNRSVLLQGIGFDLNDGYLKGTRMRWASDKQGPLGVGEKLMVRLQPGIHVITLQAISSVGLVSSDSIKVQVVDNSR